MNAAAALIRLPGGQRLKKKIYFDWPDRLALSEQQEIYSLMNLILEREDAFGFPGPLAWDEGMSLMMNASEELRRGFRRILLAREQGTNAIVGHLVLLPNKTPDSGHTGEISQVFVHPSYRGVGVLENGLKELVLESERLGIEVLNLEVRADSRLHRLWQALGFETIGTVKNYTRLDGVSFDGCYMRQVVKQLREKNQF